MRYIQDCIWDFKTSTGSINVDIFQFINMGANVNGSLITWTSSIDLVYKDNLSSAGASFHSTSSIGSYSRSSSGGGFSSINDNPFESTDYETATNTYTFRLATGTGSIDVDGTSLVYK